SLFTFLFFRFNDTATTEIYTLSLHDALPILANSSIGVLTILYNIILISSNNLYFSSIKLLLSIFHVIINSQSGISPFVNKFSISDRKSTRLNSSHVKISYAVFCLKKKKKIQK